MQKYSLEVENWSEYELVKDFSNLDKATKHGRDHFPQNNWRVFDRTAGEVAFEYDPFKTIEEEAGAELNRFATTERYRTMYAEQRADEIRLGQERQRLAERNARRRRAQVEHDQQRRDRLQGFGFVGQHPDILNDEWWDEFTEEEVSNPATEKVNWLQEGF